ncbi:MAG: hypothetical protein KAS72_07235 [Phycisphaerales bacterium]|nr:hypothetical protein [Phycisphaerales bacterium]
MRSRRDHRAVIMSTVLAGSAFFVGTAAADSYIPHRTIVEAGDAAPIDEPGWIFSSLARWMNVVWMESDDRVLFQPTLAKVFVPYTRHSLWEWTPDGLHPLMLAYDPAPGLPPEYVIDSVGHLRTNARGDTVGIASIPNPVDPEGELLSAMWIRPAGGEVEFIALSDEQWPGQPDGWSVWELGAPAIDAQGHYAIRTTLRTPEAPETHALAIWEAGEGGLVEVLHTGDPAPGFPDGVIVSDLWTGLARSPINDLGEMALIGQLEYPPDHEYTSRRVIWKYREGQFQPIVMETSSLPGIGPNTTVRGLSMCAPRINNRGNVMFWACLSDPDFETPFYVGLCLYHADTGRVEELAATPCPITWMGEQYVISSVDDWRTLFNDRDEALFIGSIDGPGVDESNDAIVGVHRAGQNVIIAREGMQAPDLPDGLTISDWQLGLRCQMNNTGMVVFMVKLEGPSVDSYTDDALYVSDLVGNIHLLMREGDDMDMSGDGSDIRRITEIPFTRTERQDLGQHMLSDSYQLALPVEFHYAPERLCIFDLSGYAPPACPADLNHDRHVDQYDLGILLAWYGRDRWGDIDGDGDTDAEDLGILLGYYGQPCESR